MKESKKKKKPITSFLCHFMLYTIAEELRDVKFNLYKCFINQNKFVVFTLSVNVVVDTTMTELEVHSKLT